MNVSIIKQWKLTASGSFGFECFQASLGLPGRVGYTCPLALASLVYSTRTCDRSVQTLILVVACWMEAS